MVHYLTRLAVSAVLIVAASELSKRTAMIGGLLASLPLVSLLTMVWLYLDTHDRFKVAGLATAVFWLVLPSLALFLILPALLRAGQGFWVSLALSCVATAGLYLVEISLIRRLGLSM
jgi:hypothetical protein